MFEPKENPEADDPAAFERLTDALRAGPESAAWSDMMEELRQQTNHADHWVALGMRKRLEDAKPFATVMPSERMTRHVMAGVSAELRPARGHWYMAIAAAAALLAISVAGVVVYSMLNRPTDNWSSIIIPQVATHNEIAHTESGRTIKFESAMPVGWERVGSAPLRAEHGLRLTSAVNISGQLGGLTRTQALPANHHFEVESSFHTIGGAQVTPEVFITDAEDYANSQPGKHEVAWTVSNEQPHIRLPDSTAIADGELLAFGRSAGLCVNIKADGNTSTIETSWGRKSSYWTGPIGLDNSKPWHLGVRFVVSGLRHAESVYLGSVKVTQK